MIEIILILSVLNIVLGLISIFQRNEQIKLKKYQLKKSTKKHLKNCACLECEPEIN